MKQPQSQSLNYPLECSYGLPCSHTWFLVPWVLRVALRCMSPENSQNHFLTQRHMDATLSCTEENPKIRGIAHICLSVFLSELPTKHSSKNLLACSGDLYQSADEQQCSFRAMAILFISTLWIGGVQTLYRWFCNRFPSGEFQ